LTGDKKQSNVKASETHKNEELDDISPTESEKTSGDAKSLEEQLEAAETKADENYDRFLRVTAEFENFKKRSQREIADYRKFANESVIKEILSTVDNLERALAIQKGGTEDFEGLRHGVEMTLMGLMDTLQRFGVSPLKSHGKPFDPNVHQAVSQEESEQHPDNTVSQELQKGYMLNDRLLRPSMVVVSKNPDVKGKSEEKETVQ